jgi:hypothetical protein
MKRLFILLGLLVALCDVADCVLLGKGGVSGSPGLSQAASILPLPCYQHTKVLSDAGDLVKFAQPPIISHLQGALPDILVPLAVLPVPLEVPHPPQISHYTYSSSSGGIPR